MKRTFAKLRSLPPFWLGLLLFKLAWLALVLGQQRWQWLVLAIVLPLQIVCLHRDWTVRFGWRALPVALLGAGLDQTLCRLGVLQFPHALLPVWLLVLWFSFALVLAQTSAALRRLPSWGVALLGAAGGTLAYYAGNRLGAVTFGVPLAPALAVLAGVWALWLPLALYLLTYKHVQLPWSTIVLLAAVMPAKVEAQSPWREIGAGEYRVMWIPVYRATLESPVTDFRFPGSAPLRLTLRYHRNVSPEQIITATREQWQRQRTRFDEVWLRRLQQCLPTITSGDRLALLVAADATAELDFNDKSVCRFDDSDFITAFVGIWLGENTTEPALRAALLGRKT